MTAARSKHGVDLVDDIVARLDDALDGYDTQRAGDQWYPATSDVDIETFAEQWANLADSINAAWEQVSAVIADTFDTLLAALSACFGHGTHPGNDVALIWSDWYEDHLDAAHELG